MFQRLIDRQEINTDDRDSSMDMCCWPQLNSLILAEINMTATGQGLEWIARCAPRLRQLSFQLIGANLASAPAPNLDVPSYSASRDSRRTFPHSISCFSMLESFLFCQHDKSNIAVRIVDRDILLLLQGCPQLQFIQLENCEHITKATIHLIAHAKHVVQQLKQKHQQHAQSTQPFTGTASTLSSATTSTRLAGSSCFYPALRVPLCWHPCRCCSFSFRFAVPPFSPSSYPGVVHLARVVLISYEPEYESQFTPTSLSERACFDSVQHIIQFDQEYHVDAVFNP
jgi:hypothetical protein